MNKLFNNSGKKIKILSNILFFLISLVGIILGIALSADTDEFFSIFIFIAPLVGWVISLFVYGYGEIIERICKMEQKISCNGNQNIETQPSMEQNNNPSENA